MAADMKKLREQIDKIDAQILKLYEERMDVVSEIGKYKIENNLPVYDAAREDAEADYGVPWERPCGLAPLTGAALRRPRPPLGARCGRGAPEAVPPVIAAAPSGIGAGAPSAPPENAGNAVKHA